MTRITVHKMTTDQNENGDPIEWSLIELNGELLPPKQTSKIDKEDNAKPPKVELGSLYFDSKVRFIFSFNVRCRKFTVSNFTYSQMIA